MRSIMANLNLGHDVADKREIEYNIAAHIVANSHSLQQAVGMLRYGSLININPSVYLLLLFANFCFNGKFMSQQKLTHDGTRHFVLSFTKCTSPILFFCWKLNKFCEFSDPPDPIVPLSSIFVSALFSGRTDGRTDGRTNEHHVW